MSEDESKPAVDLQANDPDRGVNVPQYLTDLFGMIETVTTAPTLAPRNFYQQVKLYTDSTSAPTIYRLYIYMPKLNAWHYVALT